MCILKQAWNKYDKFTFGSKCDNFILLMSHTHNLQNEELKGQVAWISEKQRLPVKTSERLVFMVRSFTVGGFTIDSRDIM